MKYYGFYRGQVMQCLNNGFCRIRIPNILECTDKAGTDENTLPLAEPAQAIGGGTVDSLTGTFSYPTVNSIVWCFFEGGNLERPVYFATSNVSSPNWNEIVVPTKQNTNKGNTGQTIEPTGNLVQFNQSYIKQSVVLDAQTERPIADKIDIRVNATPEMEKECAKATEENLTDKKGFTGPLAASVHLDNKRNTVTITAKNSIVLRAPKIMFDTTGFEQDGYLLINSNAIENLANNGPFRVIAAKVNIDGGMNNIIIQTMGQINLSKMTQAFTYAPKEVEYYQEEDSDTNKNEQ